MAGDKICAKSENIENNEKTQDIIDCHLNSNTTDEAFSDGIDYLPCPEFRFTTSACYICNGYYGPCFGEPVCATCHAFLFPDDIGLRQVPIFSEKTDDEDSGNDEPADLYYSAERRVSQQQQQQQQPQQPQPQQPQQQHQRNAVPSPIVSNDYKNISSNISIGKNENPATSSGKLYSWRKKENGSFESAGSSSNTSNSSISNNNNNDEASNSRQKLSNDNVDPLELRNTRKEELPELDEDSTKRIKDNERILLDIKINNDRLDIKVGECSRRENLTERVDMLTNYRHTDNNQETINEPGLVERLPPEVLLAVFSYLDDVSLWSAAKVCRRWYGLLLAHVPSQQWQRHVKIHWPLYRPIGKIDDDWFKVYDRLASSAPCRMCFSLMCLRAEPSRMEENSWRKNRLRSELKSLRIDPPEGIEATPLDRMCCHWQATITGPIGSPYEGGLFYLYLQVPYSYPMCPPVVKFLTKILHPNVSRHGDVGIDSIHHNWSLALTISKVLISVQSLLTDPYCQVCMEPELGEMYTNDRDRFEEVARAWTWKYAMHDVLTPTS